jgi:ABC-type cobalamin/Fe3+-siderophores transport system ATPase subunit
MSTIVTHSDIAPHDLRLAEFRVEKLFGEFNYTIPLNLDRHVTAVIAPNGTGKTLCLRMIHGLFVQRWGIFTDTTFSSVSFKFSDETVIVVEKHKPAAAADDSAIEASFRLRIKPGSGDEEVTWTPKFSDPKRVFQVERYLPFMSRITPTRWRHDQTGEVFSLPEVIDTFGNSLPDAIKIGIYGKRPEILDAIIKKIDCRLIETQRLLILRDTHDESYYQPSRTPKSTLAIARKAQTLKEIISKEINAYASLSQSLDRSFPKRVIQRPAALPVENLRAQLSNLDEKRRGLMEAGILDTEADDPVSLPQGEIEPAIARVLSVYVEDTSKKLSSLARILSKIKLFKELIDQRFVTKDVRISKQNGIDVVFNNTKIPLERLSSGEQHQLVLFFELLFEINKNSLILIDEPELSLHVAWQKKFISDLMKIIELNKFDVILATHSPQLIGRWNDLVVELGDVYEGADPDVQDGGK